MKSKFFIQLLFGFVILLPFQNFSQRLRTQILNVKADPKNNPELLATEVKPHGIELLTKLIKEGRWHLLKRYFRKETDFNSVIKSLTSKNPNTKKNIYSNLNSYKIKSISNNNFVLELDKNKNTIELNFEITHLKSDFVIDAVSITESKRKSNARETESSAVIPAFIELPKFEKGKYSLASYYENIGSYFSDAKNVPHSVTAPIPFQQINFSDFILEIKYCYKVPIIGNICDDKPYTFSLGSVITGSDDPEYNEETNPVFENIADITAMATKVTDANGFQLPYLRNKYALTSIVVDDEGQKISFFREGLEPIDYGLEDGEQSFEFPVAVKEINGFIYVLDQGLNPGNAKIFVFKFNHSHTGDYEIINLGKLNLGNLELSYPSDIGGYKGREVTDNNVLLIADINGLHSIEINPTNGLIASLPHILTFTSAINGSIPGSKLDLKEIRKVDADHNSGYTVVINHNNQIFSFPNQETYRSDNEIITTNYTKLDIAFEPSNLAYMRIEEKWYVTDYTGGMHTLDKAGWYLGGRINPGTSEFEDQLYFPNAITPNPIEDPTDPFRYRFIVANKWSRETGLKLFSPKYIISDLSIFENTIDTNLIFTFTTSGNWQAVENVTGLEFDGLYLNNVRIEQTQISLEDSLTDFPNSISLNPFSDPGLKAALKRGWNKVMVQAFLLKGETKESVYYDVDFYWLPTEHDASNAANFNQAKVDEDYITDHTKLFIYKPVNVLSNSIFISNNKELIIQDFGQLLVKSGGSFYNGTNYTQGLANLRFEENKGKIEFSDHSYICVNNNGTNVNPNFYFKDIDSNLTLSALHKRGINPILFGLSDIPTDLSSNCKTACEFLSPQDVVVNFTEEIDRSVRPFKFTADVTGSSYSNYIKFDIDKVSDSGVVIISKEIIIKRTQEKKYTLTSNTFDFEPCSKYKIKMTLGCNSESSENQVWYDDKSFTKEYNTTPVVEAGEEINVCTNSQSVKFKEFSPIPSVSGTGVWSGPGVAVDGTLNIASINEGPLPKTLVYTYTYKEWGCEKSDQKLVTVNANPAKPILSVNTPICDGQAMKLSMNYIPGEVLWIGPNNFLSSSQNPELNKISVGDTGNYKAVINLYGCLGPEASINIVVNPLPIVDAGQDETMCHNVNEYVLQGMQPSGGTWLGKGVSPSGTFSPTVAGIGLDTLIYTYTDANGCKNSDTRVIAVGPLVTAGEDGTACINHAPYRLTGQLPEGGTWSGNSISTDGLFNPSAAGIGVHTMTYSYTNSVDGCTGSSTKTITVYSAPSPATATNTGPACEGFAVGLKATLIPDVTYEWSGPNNYTSSKKDPFLVGTKVQMSGTYNVNTVANGCKSLPSSTVVNINAKPVVDAGTTQSTCRNSSPITLAASPGGGIWSGSGITTTPGVEYDDQFPGTALSEKWKVIDRDNWTGGGVTVNENITITARGRDLWKTNNEFVAVYREDITGDFDVEVQVLSQTNSSPFAKTGIVVANNFTNLSQGGYILIAVTPSNGFIFQYDLLGAVGQMENNTRRGTTQYPCWLRLKKYGKSFTAYFRLSSTSSWTQVGTATTPLNTNIKSQIGLVNTACNATTESIVKLDNFKAKRTNYVFNPSLAAEGDNLLKYEVGSGGCLNSSVKSINVSPSPIVNIISGTPSGCVSSTNKIQLLANTSQQGNFTYQWYKDSTSIAGANAQTYNVSENGNYCVVANSNCGKDSACYTLTVSDPTFANAGHDAITNGAYPAYLFGSGNGRLEWSTGETDEIIAVHPEKDTDYILAVHGQCGVATDTVKVFVDPCYDPYMELQVWQSATMRETVLGEPGKKTIIKGGGVFSGRYNIIGDIQLQGDYYLTPSSAFLVNTDVNVEVGGNSNNETSGSLTIKSATLTNACNAMWGSLIVNTYGFLKLDGTEQVRSLISNSFGVLLDNYSFSIDFTRFYNNYVSIYCENNVISFSKDSVFIKNCIFDSDKNRLSSSNLLPYYTNMHMQLTGAANYNRLFILNNTFNNCRVGISMVGGCSIINNRFTNCYQYSIGNESRSSYLFKNIIEVPSHFAESENINDEDVSIGIYHHNTSIEVNSCQIFSEIGLRKTIGIQGNYIGARDSKYVNNLISNLTQAISFSNIELRLDISNNEFRNNNIGIRISNSTSGTSNNINCNRFLGNPQQKGILIEDSDIKYIGYPDPVYNVFYQGIDIQNNSGNNIEYRHNTNDLPPNVIGPITFIPLSSSTNCPFAPSSNARLATMEVSSDEIKKAKQSLMFKGISNSEKLIHENVLKLSWEKGQSKEEFEKYIITLASFNKESFNRLAFYLLSYYQDNNLQIQIETIRNNILKNNEGNNDVKFRVKFFDFNLKNQKNYSGKISQKDSINLSEIANSGTSVEEAACLKLRYYYPFSKCGNGKKEESVISSEIPINDLCITNIYPNPTASEVTVNYQAGESTSSMSLGIFHIVTGEKIKEYRLSSDQSGKTKIDVTNLTNGVYALSLLLKGKVVCTEKLSIIK